MLNLSTYEIYVSFMSALNGSLLLWWNVFKSDFFADNLSRNTENHKYENKPK